MSKAALPRFLAHVIMYNPEIRIFFEFIMERVPFFRNVYELSLPVSEEIQARLIRILALLAPSADY